MYQVCLEKKHIIYIMKDDIFLSNSLRAKQVMRIYLKEDIDLLQQQKIIDSKIRVKLDEENNKLKDKLIKTERILEEEVNNNKE